MAYGVYYRRKENDKVWKRSAETYKNRNGLMSSRDRRFTTLEEAEEYAKRYNENYETKIKEVK